MNELNTILVIDSGCESFPKALARAHRLASEFSAELHILSCRPPDIRKISNAEHHHLYLNYSDLRQQRLQFIKNCVAQLPNAESITVHEVWNRDFIDAVTASCEILLPDIVIKSFELDHPEDSTINLPLDNALIQNCPAPLLLVRNPDWQGPAKVLAAVDVNSEHEDESLNRQVLNYAKMFADHFGSQPSLISAHLTPEIDPAENHLQTGTPQFKQMIIENQHAKIQSLIHAHDFRLKNRYVVEGLIENRITEMVADHDFQLVVIGNHRRRGATAAMLGNTAEKLIAQSPCEILALPAR